MHPMLLWSGVLGGAIAFALDRLASVLLISNSCKKGTHPAGLLGLTSSQTLLAAITLLTALIALAAGLVCWRIWRLTGEPEEEVVVGTIGNVPFWAVGGLFLNALFLVFILYTGGTALSLSTACPPP
jgi:hypothetical protein